ncbi:hypothetical protein AVEN_207802-1 [Araneus ventricosus]|uniref:Uncharacterized protein n=1 Tax=Araneus ventricosus TaxID=182803 RepID=A0A4Y2BXY5_ARAVE|nr:hypothetical protein AVEN_207802-1 [Araneus ventricosus]
MVPSSCLTVPVLLAKLKNCSESSSGKSGATPLQPRFATQSGFQTLNLEQGSLQTVIDVKIAAENWLNGQGHDFYQALPLWPFFRTSSSNVLSLTDRIGAFDPRLLSAPIMHFYNPIGRLRKKFECQHSSFNKVPVMKIMKGISKNAACPASVTVKIKLDTINTRMSDDFIRRGLVGVVTITPFHKHSLMTAETLRFLPAEDCREKFEEYFNVGMGPVESTKYHSKFLEMNPALQPSDLANSRINPTKITITY